MNNMIIFPSLDCSEIAANILNFANSGMILNVTPLIPGQLNLVEGGSIQTGIYYHQVYSDGRYIYDPRFLDSPIPLGDWKRLVKGLNPGATIKPINCSQCD